MTGRRQKLSKREIEEARPAAQRKIGYEQRGIRSEEYVQRIWDEGRERREATLLRAYQGVGAHTGRSTTTDFRFCLPPSDEDAPQRLADLERALLGEVVTGEASSRECELRIAFLLGAMNAYDESERDRLRERERTLIEATAGRLAADRREQGHLTRFVTAVGAADERPTTMADFVRVASLVCSRRGKKVTKEAGSRWRGSFTFEGKPIHVERAWKAYQDAFKG